VRAEAVKSLGALTDRLCARDAAGAEHAMRTHLLAVTARRS
jgi:DNA-binding FadR family transcriptional regulator